jgi:hypothetical protein
MFLLTGSLQKIDISNCGLKSIPLDMPRKLPSLQRLTLAPGNVMLKYPPKAILTKSVSRVYRWMITEELQKAEALLQKEHEKQLEIEELAEAKRRDEEKRRRDDEARMEERRIQMVKKLDKEEADRVKKERKEKKRIIRELEQKREEEKQRKADEKAAEMEMVNSLTLL